MTEIIGWTATQTAQAIAKNEVSVAEVTQAHLDRIDRCEPQLRAVVEPFPEAAMKQAHAMDANRPETVPPLWGVPVTVKINVDMAGHPNSNGVPAFNTTPCAEDAPVVANLKAAGAVIIGRTSTPEFSLRFFTSNPIYGCTLNPWDHSVTPGGSSGGASAAVAAGMGVLGHGNDLGGSLRYPAYCTGLATLRPSLGRVPAFARSAPEERPSAIQRMSVQGVIARSVADVQLAYTPLSRRSVLDPLWRGAASAGKAQTRRVGYCVDPVGEGVAPRVARAVKAAAEAAKSAGYNVIEIAPPMVQEAVATWGQLLNADVHYKMEPAIRQHGSAEVNGVVDGYAALYGRPDLEGYINAQNARLSCQRAWAEMLEDLDALILPVSASEPFARDQDIAQPDSLAEIMAAQRCLFMINLLGLPSACVRTLDCRPIPLGVQVVGAMMDDQACLTVAQAIEAELSFDLSPIEPVEPPASP